jgi:AICAR transformylase/IMP cyclohydrolase PurH
MRSGCPTGKPTPANPRSIVNAKNSAAKDFARTSAYGWAIAAYLSGVFSNPTIRSPTTSGGEYAAGAQFASALWALKHRGTARILTQAAALLRQSSVYLLTNNCIGKELSYNKILDLTAAVKLIGEFTRRATPPWQIPPKHPPLKHTNPCGVWSRARV